MMILRDEGKRRIALSAFCRGNKCAKVLLIALLVVVLVSCVFIVTHAQHDCVGPGCHTCAEISVCRLVIAGVAFAAMLIFTLGRAHGRLVVTRVGPIAWPPGFISKLRLLSGRVRLNC